MPKEIGKSQGESGDGDDEASPMIPTPAPSPAGRTPVSPPLQPDEEARPKALPASEHFAAHLHETSASAYLYCSMAQVFREIGPESYKTYLIKVLKDAGNPSDPIERMLIEQICLAHHNIGRLHIKAASADNLEAERIYIGAAALMTGEFRRSITTLKTYREPSKIPVGKSEVADLDTKAVQNAVNGEVGTNTGDDDEGTIPLPEPLEGRGRSAEQGQTPRIKRRRA